MPNKKKIPIRILYTRKLYFQLLDYKISTLNSQQANSNSYDYFVPKNVDTDCFIQMKLRFVMANPIKKIKQNKVIIEFKK